MQKPTKKELLEKKDNYMVLNLGYDCQHVLPYLEGVKVISALQNAEFQTTEGSYDDYVIKPLTSSPSVKIISQKDYLDQKMAHLLGVTVKEINAKPESTEP